MLARELVQHDSGPIPLDEVSFHPHSFADDAGRLFRWNGELYRGIKPERAPFYARLFREGVVDHLIDCGLLIETELTDLKLDGYAMVLRHQTVPLISYPNEWCAAMFKDAALAIVDLAIELAARGLTLKDAHPWNLLFRDTTPVHVDLTSIVPLEAQPIWPAFDEFRRFCYYPLVLMSRGHERIARALLPEYEGVLRSELLTVLRGSAPSRFILYKALERTLRSFRFLFVKPPTTPNFVLSFLKRIRQDLERIQLASDRNHQPYADTAASTDLRSQPANHQRTLQNILSALKPSVVLDLSPSAMWTTTLPAAMGLSVISVGAQASRVSAIYDKARTESLPILSLIIDFIKPTPSIGYSNHYAIGATERLRSEMVVALGLAAKTAFENHFPPELIAEGLSSFSKRWLVVDAVESEPAGNMTGSGRSCAAFAFIDALRKHFRAITVVSSDANHGALILCEK